MKDAISAQQQQIQQLQQQIRNPRSGDPATAAASSRRRRQHSRRAPPPPRPQRRSVGRSGRSLQHDVADLKTVSGNTATNCRRRRSALPTWKAHWPFTTRESPLLRAASWRQKPCGVSAPTGSDINTNRSTGINYRGASQAHMCEFYGSGRQSRISMLAQGKLDSMTMTGYVESDFLGCRRYLQQQREQLLRSPPAAGLGSGGSS